MSEDPSDGIALVPEARLKPNDLTLPDITYHSLAGVLIRGHVDHR
jgi:hypothetical protein